jgi:formylglycine-generating enzyme required for sulfatase activity
MIQAAAQCRWLLCLLFAAGAADLHAQKPPYDVFPPTEPPYYRVRYDASTKQGELTFPVNYTIWIPNDVKTLRGVIVHQHGCGEGSCKSGLTGAYDLHWQALAKKHACALLAPSYEQPEKADCQLWCDPRNGSDAAFQKCLVDLGAMSGHPELARVPWALWGHSGGGHWAGGMVLLHPDRVVAAWLRSGVPVLKADPKRAGLKVHTLPVAALKVPVMCNLGTKEGVTVKDDRFAGVWLANEAFFNEVRGKGGLVGVAVDPLTSHECGNQRYLAIPWLDHCLSHRLPKAAANPLQDMPTDTAWLAALTGGEAVPAARYKGEPLKAAWLPNEALAKAWMEYVKDTKVTDTTPPPAPTNVRVQGNKLTWEAEADLESGLASFIIERDSQFLANVPGQGKNPFGRPIFQNLQYSDTPPQPLVAMQFTDTKTDQVEKHSYRVIAVNTVGLKSKPSAESMAAPTPPKPKNGPLGMKFVPLPKATFYMGWDGTKGSAKKTEIKEVFEIAIHTVTQGQWQEVMGNNPSWFSRDGKVKDKVKDIKDEDLKHFPVETVSWNDAQEFIKKLNEKEKGKGYEYRLPSEAEWEYACRGGATSEEECSYHFYFAKPTNDLSSKEANFDGNRPFGEADKGPFLHRTTKVGSYAPNKVGLYDMHGNVWQWCEDLLKKGGSVRVDRGGSWSDSGSDCRASDRNRGTPSVRYFSLGFRLARVPVR